MHFGSYLSTDPVGAPANAGRQSLDGHLPNWTQAQEFKFSEACRTIRTSIILLFSLILQKQITGRSGSAPGAALAKALPAYLFFSLENRPDTEFQGLVSVTSSSSTFSLAQFSTTLHPKRKLLLWAASLNGTRGFQSNLPLHGLLHALTLCAHSATCA